MLTPTSASLQLPVRACACACLYIGMCMCACDDVTRFGFLLLFSITPNANEDQSAARQKRGAQTEHTHTCTYRECALEIVACVTYAEDAHADAAEDEDADEE